MPELPGETPQGRWLRETAEAKVAQQVATLRATLYRWREKYGRQWLRGLPLGQTLDQIDRGGDPGAALESLRSATQAYLDHKPMLDAAEASLARSSMRDGPEFVLCAAIYVDTGRPEPWRASYAYPETGLLFCGWRHGDCYVSLNAWKRRLWFWERWRIGRIDPRQLRGKRQGFLTSRGRFVDRVEGSQLARAAGQVRDVGNDFLTSEDLY